MGLPEGAFLQELGAALVAPHSNLRDLGLAVGARLAFEAEGPVPVHDGVEAGDGLQLGERVLKRQGGKLQCRLRVCSAVQSQEGTSFDET